MDGPLRRTAGILGSPPASGSQPAGSDMLTPGGGGGGSSGSNSGNTNTNNKPLAFSIDRIMARTPEPKSIPIPSWFQSAAPVGKPDVCPSSLHCMIPLLPLGYEPGHRLSITGLDAGHLESSPADFLGFGLNYKSQQQQQQEDAAVSQGAGAGGVAAGQYKLFRPRVVNQSSFPAMGTVCYLNCSGDTGSSCAPPAGLVNLHPMASYLLTARHKAFMAEKNKPGLQQHQHHQAGERFPVSGVQAFKELSQSQIQHYMKERDHILNDKIFKGSAAAAAAAAARLSGSCPGNKPKVFTCEVCGKVRSEIQTRKQR